MAPKDDIYRGPLDEEQKATNQIESPTGSVFINNTSYSGADIKLVVHIYDTATTKQERLAQLIEDQKGDEAEGQAVRSLISEYSVKLSKLKPATQEYSHISTIYNRLQARLAELTTIMMARYEEGKRIEKTGVSASTKVLAEVQTLSISTHRDKRPVRALGKVYPVAFSRGQREIAGSIIFTVFNQHVLYELLDAHPSDFDAVAYTSSLLDQLPPMDITIAFANEYGQLSRMGIYGVEFVNEGQTMSIEDIMTENVCNYVARDFDPMRSVARRNIDEGSRLMNEWVGMKASDLILEDEYQNVKSMLDPFERFKRRSNPFL